MGINDSNNKNKMEEKSLFIICPRTKQFCGVFDHAKKIKKLFDNDLHVEILSNHHNFEAGPEQQILKQWQIWDYLFLLKFLRRKKSIINIQYVGWMYQKKGIPIFLILFVLLLKVMKIKIITTFHETYVPGINWRWKILKIFQQPIFILLLFLSDFSLFSVEKWSSEHGKMFPSLKKRFRFIPIGSNFSAEKIATTHLREKYGIKNLDKIISTFNPSGSGKDLEFILKTFSLITNQQKKLLIIGANNLHKTSSKIINFLNCDETKSKELLSISDVYLSTFSDGISSRRSSCLSAVSLGIPTVTNWGSNTDGFFKKSPLVFIKESHEAAREIDNLLKNQNAKLRKKTLAFYHDKFDEKIIKKMYFSII